MRARVLGGLGLVALVALAGAVAWRLAEARTYAASTAMTPTNAAPTRDDVSAERAVQLRVWGEALRADPTSALVLGQLAALHAQQARERGTFDDYLVAERLARQSLTQREQRNGATAATLVTVLLAQHRFAEAYREVQALVAREPDVVVYRAMLGEVAMELGDYDTAGRAFDGVWRERASLSVAPRLARWLELRGQVREARRLLATARTLATERRDVALESKAWFSLRLGDLERRAGRPRAAAAAYRQGLAVAPNDARLLVAMGQLALGEAYPAQAAQWSEQALAERVDPSTLLVLTNSYEALGEGARARSTADALQAMTAGVVGPPHRDWLLWQLDHQQQVAAILARAEQDLSTRADVYGFDLAAWASWQAGRVEAARRYMTRALSLGTVDPLLQRHAAVIFAAAKAESPADATAAQRERFAFRITN